MNEGGPRGRYAPSPSRLVLPQVVAGAEEAGFRAGRALLEDHRPEGGRLLEPWKGREGELLERVARGDPDLPREVLHTAREALEMGALLGREGQAEQLRVPGALKDLEADLQRASARIRACGQGDPFGGEVLKTVPPSALRGALEEMRAKGLLVEGPRWVLGREQVPDLAAGLRKRLEVERPFPELMPGRGRGA